jgi:hypothetical protein
MFDDQRVLRAVPARGFLHEYVTFARARNPAIPIVYHVGAAYALLSALVTTDPRIAVPDMDRPTSLWIMLVGGTGSGKTSAFNIARSVYEQALGEPPVAISGTAEGLYTLAKEFHKVDPTDPDGERKIAVLRLWEDDLGKMLSSTARKQGHGGSVRAAMLGLYDGQARREVLATKVHLCPRNRTGVFVGVTPAQLTRDTDAAEWETGFFSRFMMLYSKEGMVPAMPSHDDATLIQMEQRVVAIARRIVANERFVNRRTGEAHPWALTSMLRTSEAFASPTAKRLYVEHRDLLKQREIAASRYAKGPIQRATDAAMRTAALVMLSDGDEILTEPGGWRFSERAIEHGFSLAWLGVQSAEWLANHVTADPFGRLCAAVVEALQASPRPLTAGDIHYALAKDLGRTQKRRVEEALQVLELDGTVTASSTMADDTSEFSGQLVMYALSPDAFGVRRS